MDNIIIISETQGFLLSTLQEHLESADFAVSIVAADVDKLSKVPRPVGAAVIYASEELLEDQQALIYIRDRSVEEGTAIFLVGNEGEVEEIEKIIPRSMMRGIYFRPINVNAVAQELTNYIREQHQAERKKVLVVDDSGAMLRNVKGWLEDKYQVILANSGTMAIKYLTLNRPDLILLDYEMPVIDGRQVLEMIRSEADFRDVPVIFLTGKDDRESVMNVMAMKPDGYLLKSLRPEQIVQAVDDFFVHKKWTNITENK